jgi:hypothetical protein
MTRLARSGSSIPCSRPRPSESKWEITLNTRYRDCSAPSASHDGGPQHVGLIGPQQNRRLRLVIIASKEAVVFDSALTASMRLSGSWPPGHARAKRLGTRSSAMTRAAPSSSALLLQTIRPVIIPDRDKVASSISILRRLPDCRLDVPQNSVCSSLFPMRMIVTRPRTVRVLFRLTAGTGANSQTIPRLDIERLWQRYPRYGWTFVN